MYGLRFEGRKFVPKFPIMENKVVGYSDYDLRDRE